MGKMKLILVDEDKHLGEERIIDYDLPTRKGKHDIDLIMLHHRGRNLLIQLTAEVSHHGEGST